MKNILLIKEFLIVFLLLPTFLFATGNIKGVVTDSLSNERLVGANIILLGTSIGSATDIEGEYLISTIPAGRYTVRFSYVGYKFKDVFVTVVDNRTIEINISLVLTEIQGKEIVITGQALGQAAAINQQLTSNTIINVVSEQKIKELPDANAAEALGRLPGVSIIRSGGEANKIILRGLSEDLTTITMDGIKIAPTDADQRGIDLSTISQGSLSGITLTKAVTSDMSADAIAGNINFVTKIAPETRDIQIDVFGMYSNLDKTTDQFNFQGRYGERFFDNLLGVQVFGNIEKRNRSSENFSVTYDQTLLNSTDYQIDDFTITYSPEIRKRGGGRILLDFKTPDDGLLKLNAEYARTDRKVQSLNRNYPVTTGEVGYEFSAQDINTQIKNISLKGTNHLYDWQLDWSLSYSESSSETPYSNSASFSEPSILENGQVVSGMSSVPVDYRKGTSYEKLVPYALNNFGVAYFTNQNVTSRRNLDYEKTVSLDVKKSYNIFDLAGELKFGGKYNSKYHRRYQESRYGSYYNGVGNGYYDYVRLSDGSVVRKDLARYGFTDLQIRSNLILLTNFINQNTRDVFNKYLLDPMIDATILRNWYEMNINGVNPLTGLQEFRWNLGSSGSNYNLFENVSAGYIMNTLNMGTFATLITGIRIEEDDNTYNAFYTNQALTLWSQFMDTTSYHKETIVLPNLNLILRPTEYMNVRLSAYRALLRPGFNNRLPTYILGTTSLNLGNTNLKNADAWNFESNVQFYGKNIGLFSISVFYKRINNQVERLSSTPIQSKAILDSLGIEWRGPSSTTSYTLTYPYNSDRPTRVWGLEVEHQANLRFLPGLLSNIVLSYNFSLMRNESYAPAVRYVDYFIIVPPLPFPVKKTKVILYENKIRLADSPEFFGNITLGYDIGNFSGRISYFYQGEFYNGYSADGYSNNIQKAFSRVDLSLKQKITDLISIGLNINNINNASEGTYLENTTTLRKLETSSYIYGTTADLWLRVSM